MKKRLLAMMFGTIMALLFAEIVLQLFDPFSFRVRGDEIVLPANVQYTIRNSSHTKLDEQVIHTKNSLGFRGQERPTHWKGSVTVITVGGSTTECYYLSDDKTWQAEVDRRLADQIDHFWINNAGLDGHSTFGHAILLRDYLAKLKPDYVLFLVGINDVGREDLSRFERGELANTSGSWIKSLARRSDLIALAHNLYRNYRAFQQGVSHRQIEFAGLPPVEIEATRRADILSHHQDAFLAGYEARLLQLLALCREHEIIPILMTQPLAVGHGIDPATGIDLAQVKYKDVNGEVGWAMMELYNDVTRRVAREQGVPQIDLAAKLEKNTDFFYDFTHFTNTGAQRVGRIVADGLLPILRLDLAK